ncbi:hypothetical protein PAP18089_04625 [Pandoraea apista]|uniref:Uncharacterized protein n=1 Tax=Pandoraea apista TaxID=93218 RepID=A0A5E5PAA0_9BURK|nr:hypothetical protein PAP18089_04625 [Pandoraea apista]
MSNRCPPLRTIVETSSALACRLNDYPMLPSFRQLRSETAP